MKARRGKVKEAQMGPVSRQQYKPAVHGLYRRGPSCIVYQSRSRQNKPRREATFVTMNSVMSDINLIRNILSHLCQRREAMRTRRVSLAFREACDSMEPSRFIARVILACSETGKVLDLYPLSSRMVEATGAWVQKRAGCNSQPRNKEPNWITGICINPQDKDLYALQYRCPGVIRFSGNSMRYKHIAFKHPKLKVGTPSLNGGHVPDIVH